ncbi:5-formyltetrahydrofolate cyclo-ligase [Oscillibacter sp.]|uniref:5-formyltetrahydrofolate cyclo-ligase n=1 Tax=Oscillibacter sp. TaxID=1945593 RepID=UPI00257CB258|nr:5-formyltetrahydrofolate cyclo-ligase [Oscillibacter sp.]
MALPEYRSAGAVFCFVSAGREIDTRPILEQTLADGKMLCVPLCVADGIMELRAIRNLEELFPGAYGILEPPADSPALSPDQIDLAVIPCVTCSREGRRLGRGGGYYDRFLAHYRGAAVLLCRSGCCARRSLRRPRLSHPWVLTEAGLLRTARHPGWNDWEKVRLPQNRQNIPTISTTFCGGITSCSLDRSLEL